MGLSQVIPLDSRGVVHPHDKICIKMAGRQNGAEESHSIDLSLDLKNPDDHEVTLGTDSKKKEKEDPAGAPPTFGQGVGDSRPAGARRAQQRITEQPRPILKKSSQSVTPDVDNRSWQFVEDHSQNDIMSCKICLDVLVAPHLITCCGECVCKKCINSHQQREAAIREDKKPLCPFCRKAEFKLIENLDLKKSIGKLKVYCLYRKSGCMWSGKLQEGEAHLQECVFCPIDCPNGCREYGKIERRNLPSIWLNAPCKLWSARFSVSVASRRTHFHDERSRLTPIRIFTIISFYWLDPILNCTKNATSHTPLSVQVTMK